MAFLEIPAKELKERCMKALMALAVAKFVHGDPSPEVTRAKELLDKVCDHWFALHHKLPVDSEGNLGTLTASGFDATLEMDQLDRCYQKDDIKLLLGGKEANDGRNY